jgi:hypothetical protein
MGAVKVSVSLSDDVVSWVREQAHAGKTTFSAVLNETVRQARRDRALDEVLEWLDAPELTPEELDAYRQRWGVGSLSTRERSSRSSGAASPPRKRSARRGS